MDKLARKLFAKATQGQAKRKKEQDRLDRLGKTGQQFCSGCYAVLLDGRCPQCDLQLSTWDKWCRNCLRVHNAAIKTCKPWAPPTE